MSNASSKLASPAASTSLPVLNAPQAADVSTPDEGPPQYDRPVKLRITCLNLRHKLMYVDARHMVRGMTDNSSSTRIFWCSKTMDCLGPDGESVSVESCSNGRACYRHGG